MKDKIYWNPWFVPQHISLSIKRWHRQAVEAAAGINTQMNAEETAGTAGDHVYDLGLRYCHLGILCMRTVNAVLHTKKISGKSVLIKSIETRYNGSDHYSVNDNHSA